MPHIAKFCIPAFVLMTAIYSFVNAKDRSLKQGSLLLTLALAFAFCADVVINFISSTYGVAVFFIVHTLLIIFFVKKKPFEVKEIKYIIPLLAIGVLFFIAIYPGLAAKTQLHIYGIAAYLLLLTIILWRALCLYNDKDNLKIILGSVLFYLGDISVVMILAFGHSPVLDIVLNTETWLKYTPALFLLSLIDNK